MGNIHKRIKRWAMREAESTVLTSENYCCQTYATHNVRTSHLLTDLCQHYGNIFHVICTSASHLKPTLNVIFIRRLLYNYSVTTITTLYGARNLFLFISYNGQEHLVQRFWNWRYTCPQGVCEASQVETWDTVHSSYIVERTNKNILTNVSHTFCACNK
jgi:hypothetical protein